MRTTIELKPDHRARLLELAARRGEKGFSSIVAEALELYLESAKERNSVRRRALRLCGAISKAEADRLRRETAALRKSWR